MNCQYCKADCVHRGEQKEKECIGYIPMTNADRIRAMSDEELGDFLGEWAEKALCWMKDSHGEVLYWLQLPAE